MNKFMVNVICALVPSRQLRKKIRKKLLVGSYVEIKDAVINTRLDASEHQRLASLIYRCSAAAVLHPQTFGPYKNAFAGREVVLVAAGPTANDYKPIEGAIHVACNRSFMLEGVLFDFLFAMDYMGISSFVNEFAAYRGRDCVKFIGDRQGSREHQFPESLFLKLENARKYKTDRALGPYSGLIPVDLDLSPLWNSCSIAHQAFQFILFTNPKRVYLVGCDCTGGLKGGHFIKGEKDEAVVNTASRGFWDSAVAEMLIGWQKLKDFASMYYPDTEIISINPVGLKGLFKDVFTADGEPDQSRD